jgi:multiple antibiotic resistance protein
MAIYDIFEHVEKCVGESHPDAAHIELGSHPSHFTLGATAHDKNGLEGKSSLFSSLAARLFFFMLLIADMAWAVYATALFVIAFTLNLVTGFKVSLLSRFYRRRLLNWKRAFICAISLLVALFSPALGTMFACTYFLMYDKKGIEEVVPSVLQDQFRELFIALGVIIFFNFLGNYILLLLKVSTQTIMIAGGLILFMIAIRMIFPKGQDSQKLSQDGEPFIVPLAIPFVAGPSVLAAVMIYSSQESHLTMIGAIISSWIATFLILIASPTLKKILGSKGISACERLMGLLLTLVAVQMFLEGIASFLHH